jgi:hypothetical protein
MNTAIVARLSIGDKASRIQSSRLTRSNGAIQGKYNHFADMGNHFAGIGNMVAVAIAIMETTSLLKPPPCTSG